jgi:AraC-like DNA-binding protein
LPVARGFYQRYFVFFPTSFMQFRLYTPHVLLREFTHSISVVHAEMKTSVKELLLCTYPPTPQCSLFFYICDRIKVRKEGDGAFVLQPRSVVIGQQYKRVTIEVAKTLKAVRVDFHPGGLHRLLRIPMDETIDGHWDAEDVFGNELRTVNDRLGETENFDVMYATVEAFLLERTRSLKRSLPFDIAMRELVRANGNLTIEQLSSLSCLSLRQFERVCKERVGLPPKLYARLVRFSNAYRMREKFPGKPWVQIAYDCGYFDQMHLIRDFREFAGITPKVIERELENSPIRMQALIAL